jgi:hypothetical protein
MKVLHTLDRVPPGSWRFQSEEFGLNVQRPQWAFLLEEVRNMYFNNDKPVPANLSFIIQDWLCDQIKIEHQTAWCHDVTPPSKMDMLKRAAHALKEWASKGFPLVTDEQLLERRATCEQCPMWKGDSGLGLGACGACGCTGLKLTVATENCPQGKWKALV